MSLDLSKDRTLTELSACPDSDKFENHADRFLCGPQFKGPQRKRLAWFLDSVQSKNAFNLVSALPFWDPDLIFQRFPALPSYPPLLHSDEKGSGSSGTTNLERSSCLPSELLSIERCSKSRADSSDSSSSKRARCAASWPMQLTFYALPAARAFASTLRTRKARYRSWNTSYMSSTGYYRPNQPSPAHF